MKTCMQMWLQHWFWFVIWFFCKVAFKIFCFASFFDTSLNHNTIFHFRLLLKVMTKTFKKCKKKTKLFLVHFTHFWTKQNFPHKICSYQFFFFNHCGKSKPPNKQKKNKKNWVDSKQHWLKTDARVHGWTAMYL